MKKNYTPKHMKRHIRTRKTYPQPILVLVLALALIVGLVPTMVMAEDSRLGDVVNFEYGNVLYRGSGTDIPVEQGSSIGQYDELSLHYNFTINKELASKIQEGVHYVLPLPEHFILNIDNGNITNMPISDDSGTNYGTLYLENNSTYVVFNIKTLNESLEKATEALNGHISFMCKRDPDYPPQNYAEQNEFKAHFENGTELTYKCSELEEQLPTIFKTCENEPINGIYTWVIRYEPFKYSERTDIEIHDIISSGHKYVENSAKVKFGWVDDNNYTNISPEKGSDNVLIFKGDAVKGTDYPVFIKYETAIDPEYQNEQCIPDDNASSKTVEYTNTVEVWGKRNSSSPTAEKFDDVPEVTSKATMSYEWIKKYAVVDGDTVKWTVEFTPALTDITYLTFKDTIPSTYLEPPTTVTVNSSSYTPEVTGNVFEIDLSGIIPAPSDGKYTITYETKIKDNAFTDLANTHGGSLSLGKNNAQVSFNYKTKQHTVAANSEPMLNGYHMLTKDGQYNIGDDSVTWTIVINPESKLNMKELSPITLTDELQDNLEFVENSVTLDRGNLSKAPFISTDGIESWQHFTNLIFEIDTSNVGNEPITLKYKTKFKKGNTQNWAYNRATLKYGKLTEVADKTVDKVNVDNLLTKSGSSYDMNSNSIKWEIGINNLWYNQYTGDISGVTLTDTLPVGVEYDAAQGVKLYKNDTDEQTLSDVSYNKDTRQLTITIGNIQAANAPVRGKIVYYTTVKIDELENLRSGDTVELKNHVDMEYETNGEKIDASTDGIAKFGYSQQENNGMKMVDKSGKLTQEGEKTYIDYSVNINPYGFEMDDKWSVTDTFPNNMTLIKDSVQLYKAEVSGSSSENSAYASFKESTEIKIDENAVKITEGASSSSFTLKLPKGTKSCILKYRMEVINPRASYSNRIALDHDGAGKISNNSDTFLCSYANIDAGIDNSAACTLYIIKTDNENKPISNAKFVLTDKIGTEYSPANNGNQYVFSGLTSGDYILQEIFYTGYNYKEQLTIGNDTIVNGNNKVYDPSGNKINIHIEVDKDNPENNVIELPIINEKNTTSPEVKTFTLGLNKRDANSGDPLKGVGFTIYGSDGKTILDTQKTNEKGHIDFKLNIKEDTYYIKETSVPDGYAENSLAITFTPNKYIKSTVESILSNGMIKVAISDISSDDAGKNIGTISATNSRAFKLKIDKHETGNPDHHLAGAEFTLFDSNKKELETAVTGDDGTLQFKTPLANNSSYLIKETGTPAGYEIKDLKAKATIDVDGVNVEKIDDSTVKITLNVKKAEAGSLITITAENARMKGSVLSRNFKLKINKQDYSQNPLKGVTFTLYSDKNCTHEIAQGTTGDKGELIFKDGDNEISLNNASTYYIKETAVPKGYFLGTLSCEQTTGIEGITAKVIDDSKTTIELRINTSEEVNENLITITATNNKSFNLAIDKQDNNNEPVKGVLFTVYGSKNGEIDRDNTITTGTTNENGHLTFGKPIENSNTYFIEETDVNSLNAALNKDIDGIRVDKAADGIIKLELDIEPTATVNESLITLTATNKKKDNGNSGDGDNGNSDSDDDPSDDTPNGGTPGGGNPSGGNTTANNSKPIDNSYTTDNSKPVENVSSNSIIKDAGELIENYSYIPIIVICGGFAAALIIFLRKRQK